MAPRAPRPRSGAHERHREIVQTVEIPRAKHRRYVQHVRACKRRVRRPGCPESIGPPYRLSPTDLYTSFLVTSGAMTNRIQRLEEAALVIRSPDPYDRRGILVGLTARGHRLIDRAVEAHLANERRLHSSLGPHERAQLAKLLAKVLIPL